MDAAAIVKNLKEVGERIARAAERAGRDPASVRLVAVSKTKGPEHVRAAMDAGQTLFGENYVQELVSKAAAVGPGADWHFIGHLQTNKVKKVVGTAGTVQTVDRIELAAELEKRAAAAGTVMDCLIEVNLAGEESKSGIAPEGVAPLLRSCGGFQHLKMKGLMCIPPFGPPELTRPYFIKLRELMAELRGGGHAGEWFSELSMGMSGDVEAAVEEGATIVRVGTAIFGER